MAGWTGDVSQGSPAAPARVLMQHLSSDRTRMKSSDSCENWILLPFFFIILIFFLYLIAFGKKNRRGVWVPA